MHRHCAKPRRHRDLKTKLQQGLLPWALEVCGPPDSVSKMHVCAYMHFWGERMHTFDSQGVRAVHS